MFGACGRAGDSMVPYVSVCLGYVGVDFGRVGGFVCLCFLRLLVLVAAMVSSVSFGSCWYRSPQWFRLFLFVLFWSRSVSVVSFVSVCLGWFKCWVLGAKKTGRGDAY